MDFMHDQLEDGYCFRLFNVIHDFSRTVRYEWLSLYYWPDLDEVQLFATQWMYDYNHDRPNMALGGIKPKQRLTTAA